MHPSVASVLILDARGLSIYFWATLDGVLLFPVGCLSEGV